MENVKRECEHAKWMRTSPVTIPLMIHSSSLTSKHLRGVNPLMNKATWVIVTYRATVTRNNARMQIHARFKAWPLWNARVSENQVTNRVRFSLCNTYDDLYTMLTLPVLRTTCGRSSIKATIALLSFDLPSFATNPSFETIFLSVSWSTCLVPKSATFSLPGSLSS